MLDGVLRGRSNEKATDRKQTLDTDRKFSDLLYN